jgi:hypothetical protein
LSLWVLTLSNFHKLHLKFLHIWMTSVEHNIYVLWQQPIFTGINIGIVVNSNQSGGGVDGKCFKLQVIKFHNWLFNWLIINDRKNFCHVWYLKTLTNFTKSDCQLSSYFPNFLKFNSVFGTVFFSVYHRITFNTYLQISRTQATKRKFLTTVTDSLRGMNEGCVHFLKLCFVQAMDVSVFQVKFVQNLQLL